MSTWNPADKSADITLSGSNRIATRNTGADAWKFTIYKIRAVSVSTVTKLMHRI